MVANGKPMEPLKIKIIKGKAKFSGRQISPCSKFAEGRMILKKINQLHNAK